jgi:hypothetical protein
MGFSGVGAHHARESVNVPVFAVSGERHDRPDPASGFAGYFLKPMDLDVLVSTLSRAPRRAQ